MILNLSGCATMIGDKQDLLVIESNDQSAEIKVNGNIVGKGSAEYALPRGNQATITVSKIGCDDRSIQTKKEVVGATFLNLFFLPGFIVDAITGSMQKTSPTSYSVTPQCLS